MNRPETSLDDLANSKNVVSLYGDRRNDRAPEAVVERITSAAMQLLDQCGAASKGVAVHVPGRIEVLGKHTDYAGGQSLTCAAERAFTMVAGQSDQKGLGITDQVSGTTAFIPYDESPDARQANWVMYPTTVVQRIVNNFGIPATGVSIVFNSDIPRSSGLSSSSAFVTGIWLCLMSLTDRAESAAFIENIQSASDVASYLGCVENGADFANLSGDSGVGTMGGAQDHTAILFSHPGELGYYQYQPLRRIGRVKLPEELSFVVASSGVHAHKAGGAKDDYNNAVNLARMAVDIWNRATDSKHESLEAVIASPEFSMDRFQKFVETTNHSGAPADSILGRVQQFLHETRSVLPTAIQAIEKNDYITLGKATAESQRMADELLNNQVTETRFLVSAASDAGAIASSAFGAGYGGSVWSLVEKRDAPAFLRRWFASYGSSFQERLRQSCFFQDVTGPGATLLGVNPAKLLIEPKL